MLDAAQIGIAECVSPDPTPTYCLIARPRQTINIYWLGHGEHRFLRSLHEEKNLETALGALDKEQPLVDLSTVLQNAIARELFTDVEVSHET